MTPQLLTAITLEELKEWTADKWPLWSVEPKYDGARAIYRDGKLYSRTGKVFHNVDHILDDLAGINTTLDGELYGENWADTMSVIRASKTKKDGRGIRYAVFDMPEERSELPYRRAKVLHLVDSRRFTYVHRVIARAALSYEEFLILNTRHLEDGCDGTVLKYALSTYEEGRSKTWLKVKPVMDFDAVVTDVEPGEGKYRKTLGALVCVYNDTTFRLSGMTDKQRDDWWANPPLGQRVEVACRGFHPSGAPIEPRFQRLRGDE